MPLLLGELGDPVDELHRLDEAGELEPAREARPAVLDAPAGRSVRELAGALGRQRRDAPATRLTAALRQSLHVVDHEPWIVQAGGGRRKAGTAGRSAI